VRAAERLRHQVSKHEVNVFPQLHVEAGHQDRVFDDTIEPAAVVANDGECFDARRIRVLDRSYDVLRVSLPLIAMSRSFALRTAVS